jgi:hypothetical protein
VAAVKAAGVSDGCGALRTLHSVLLRSPSLPHACRAAGVHARHKKPCDVAVDRDKVCVAENTGIGGQAPSPNFSMRCFERDIFIDVMCVPWGSRLVQPIGSLRAVRELHDVVLGPEKTHECLLSVCNDPLLFDDWEQVLFRKHVIMFKRRNYHQVDNEHEEVYSSLTRAPRCGSLARISILVLCPLLINLQWDAGEDDSRRPLFAAPRRATRRQA